MVRIHLLFLLLLAASLAQGQLNDSAGTEPMARNKKFAISLGLKQQNLIDYVAEPNEYRGSTAGVQLNYRTERARRQQQISLAASAGHLPSTRNNPGSFKFDSLYTVVHQPYSFVSAKLGYDHQYRLSRTSAPFSIAIGVHAAYEVEYAHHNSFKTWIHGGTAGITSEVNYRLRAKNLFRMQASFPLVALYNRPSYIGYPEDIQSVSRSLFQYKAALAGHFVNPDVRIEYRHVTGHRIDYGFYAHVCYLYYAEPRPIKALTQELGISFSF